MGMTEFLENYMNGEVEQYWENIRLHGNGFIQLDIGPEDDISSERLHIWSDELPPAQRVRTAIHDHRFSFVSKVLLGTLVNLEYDFKASRTGEHALYTPNVKYRQDTTLVPTGSQGDFTLVREVQVNAGDEYKFQATAFHDTGWVGLMATYFHKTLTLENYAPRVACLLPFNPDNDFDRYGTKVIDLWPFVDRVVERIAPLYGYC